MREELKLHLDSGCFSAYADTDDERYVLCKIELVCRNRVEDLSQWWYNVYCF